MVMIGLLRPAKNNNYGLINFDINFGFEKSAAVLIKARCE